MSEDPYLPRYKDQVASVPAERRPPPNRDPDGTLLAANDTTRAVGESSDKEATQAETEEPPPAPPNNNDVLDRGGSGGINPLTVNTLQTSPSSSSATQIPLAFAVVAAADNPSGNSNESNMVINDNNINNNNNNRNVIAAPPRINHDHAPKSFLRMSAIASFTCGGCHLWCVCGGCGGEPAPAAAASPVVQPTTKAPTPAPPTPPTSTAQSPTADSTLAPVIRTDSPTTKAPSTKAPTTASSVVQPTTKAPTTVAPVKLGIALDSEIKLTASDGAESDSFGYSVSVDGDVMAVGAYPQNASSGAVYVYVRSSGNDWTEQAKLLASDGTNNDLFGFSVAVSGKSVVVGAYQDDTPVGADCFACGSVYVYTESSTGRWTEQAHLMADDGANDDRLGYSVAIYGDTIVAGASGADSFQGSAYVFVKSGSGWTKQAELMGSGGADQDSFGHSVAISGDTLVVGVLRSENPRGVNTGSAHVYARSGDVWTEQARLTASDGDTDDYFGNSVAISGDTIVVGAPQDDSNIGTDSGSVFVYSRLENDWIEQAKLTASGGGGGDLFGTSVAISGDFIVAGTASAAYVYYLSAEDDWTEQTRLEASDGVADDSFGTSVSISGETVMVGAHEGQNSGAVYIYS